jgi:predicted nucleic acid-binding protein
VGVIVFDSDVLIGFLNASDPHHGEAREWMRRALTPGTQRLLSAVNYSEILVGPLRVGRQEEVERMVVRFGIAIVVADGDLARRAAAVRARTGIKLPDAYALATCVHAEHRGATGVELATFDERVRKAHAALHPAG